MSQETNPSQGADRVDAIRQQFRKYGEASIEAHKIIRKFGSKLIEDFNAYLTSGNRVVFGVIPYGDWEWDNYRDAAFSNYNVSLLSLRPVNIGIGVRVQNIVDDGATDIRLVVTVRKFGHKLKVAIGNVERDIPLDYDDSIPSLCADLYHVLENFFGEELSEYVEGDTLRPKIGFLSNQ